MSRDKNSDNSVLKLIKKLEHRKSDSDNSLSNKGLSKSSMKGRKGSSLASDKNPTDKGATCDKINTPAASDNGSIGKGTTHEKTDKRPVKDVARDTKVTRLESDKYCGAKSSTSTSQSHQLIITNSTTKPASNTVRKSTSDKGTTPVTLISGGTASDLSARVLSTNDEEFIIKTRVSDTEVNKRLNDMLVTPITRPELIMIDDVIRTRLISNPVATDKTFPIHVSHVYSTAAQINGDILVKSKAPADGSGRESNADDNAAALNPISNNDGRDKSLRRTDPSKDKSGLVVRARRPDSLTLSPMSPSDTDEDRTPRPLSGTFKSTDATPISEFSFVELPIRFRQYLDDNRLIRVPKPPYHHSSGVLEEQRKMENETRDAYKKLGTGDARETSREVSDDITVALDWIQQELVSCSLIFTFIHTRHLSNTLQIVHWLST